MRIRAAIVLASALLAMAAAPPARAQRGIGGQYGSPHDMPHDEADRPVSRDPVARAEDLRLHGECDKAVPLLRTLADRPSGAEIPDYNLGLCLLELAGKQSDAASAAAMRKEAAQAIVKAANSNFARAQSEAVTLYLDGTGVDPDPVEAEKWAIIYRRNPNKFNFALPDIGRDTSRRLAAALTDAQESQAESRADNWSPAISSAD
jgi:hypothetical protein